MSAEIWLCDLSYTQQGVSAEVMPAAVGGIAAYCESRIEQGLAIHLFKYPERLIETMREGKAPRIVGFSNYSWNLELSYAFAQILKRRFPGIAIVMGGPNYPSDPEEQRAFLLSRPDVDFYICREGELPFAALAQAILDSGGDLEAVKALRLDSVHALSANDAFLAGNPAPRLPDLSVLPSPYLTGKMDEFFDGKLMPIIQTTRGCPFRCTYCNEGHSYFSKICRYPAVRIASEIDYIGRKMAEACAEGGRNDLFIADDNFGMYEPDLETARALARTREVHGWPEYMTVATGKNNVHLVLETARILQGRMRLTGSVQSLDPDVLKNIHRSNEDVQVLLHLAQQAAAIGANSHGEVILGLPGDSVEKHLKSIAGLIDAGFDEVRMYQLMLFLGAEVASQEIRRRFGMKTHYRLIPRSFGDYAVDEKTRVTTAEIEEIVTSQDSLSFEDYLHCRRFNLMVNVFYNDGVFHGILKLIRYLGISRYEWIRSIFEHRLPDALSGEIQCFLRETREELWESCEELAAFSRKPENVARFIGEELGGNVILKYKALMLKNHLRELADVARTTVLALIAGKGKLTPEVEAAVEDSLTFEVMIKEDIWNGDYGPRRALLRLDVEKFLNSANDAPLSDFILPAPKEFTFRLTDEQIATIERALNAYGRGLAGLARIFTRVHVKSLNRHVSC